jgi:hypothetical protein
MGKKRGKDEGDAANVDDVADKEGRHETKRRKKDSRKSRKEKQRAADAHSADSGHMVEEKAETNQLAVLESSSSPASRCISTSKPVFVERSFRLSVALLPIDLRSTVAAVENSLRTSLLRYNDQFGGVLLAFWDVRLLNDESLTTFRTFTTQSPARLCYSVLSLAALSLGVSRKAFQVTSRSPCSTTSTLAFQLTRFTKVDSSTTRTRSSGARRMAALYLVGVRSNSS